MIFKNGKVFIDGEFVTKDIRVLEGTIIGILDPIDPLKSVGSTKPVEKDEDIVDCTGKMIWPGLFDIHTHGCLGFDFSKSNPSEMQTMCEFYAAHGVTSILATTMTNEDHQYKRAMDYIRQTMEFQKTDKNHKEAVIRGINMEGPFFGPEKKGAHDIHFLRPISQQLLDEFDELSGHAIRLVDVDPTLDGAMEFIKNNREHYTVSLAHTPCNYEVAEQAVEAGAVHVTHLFNAMLPLLSREPGLVGAASEFGLDSEIICDGIHIHPAVIHLMFRAMPEQMVLISDSINPTGLPDGKFVAGGLPIVVRNGKAFLEDGTLAGSTITLFDAVKHAVAFGVPLEEALLSASYRPAKSVRLEQEAGSIALNRSADLLVVNEQLELEQVYVHGNKTE